MTSKIIGAIIIIGVIIGAIFLVKFFPVYTGANHLQEGFNRCMADFENQGYEGCRRNIKSIIEKEKLDLTVDDVYMKMKILDPDSVIRAEWDQTIDFFGIYQYKHHFKREHKGKPPMRH